MLRFFLPFLFCVGFAAADFLPAEQRVQLAFGQDAVTLVFRNSGAAITKAKPLCDCTTVSVQGNELTARVDTSRFDQSTDKQIEVTTADGRTTRLTMHFDVPQAIVLSTGSLVWKVGEAPTPKVLTISLPKGSPAGEVTEAAISGDDFDFIPAKGKNNREYRVTVTPRNTSRKALNRLVIKTASADPRFAQRIIYLQVRK